MVVLLCITALAAGLRFYRIDRLPPGLSYDEALNNLFAFRIQSLLPPPVFIPQEFGEEPAHMVLIAILYRLAGHPFAEAGRLASAIGGVVAVFALYFAAREMFRSSVSDGEATLIGLLSAGVLAILYWHVHYSRLGMEPTMVTTFSVPAFYLFWLALNRRRWYWFGLAGAALALCLYTYAAGYVLPLIVVLYLLWRWGTQPNTLKAEWRSALVYVTGAFVVYAPHLIFFIRHPEWLTTRPAQATGSKNGAMQVILNVGRMVGGLVWRGDTNLRLNLPGRPALDPLQSITFIVGVWHGLGRSLRPGTIFAVIWFVVMLIPSVFSDVAPHFGRALGATPPLAILIALGLVQISKVKFQISNFKWTIWIGVMTVAVMLGYSTVTMARDYFVTWARDPGLFTAFDVGLRQSAEYLASLPRDDLISLSPVDRDLPIFRFTFHDDVSRLKTFNGRRCTVYPVQPGHDFTHVAIVAEESNSLQALQRVFPSGQVVKTFKSLSSPYAVAFRVNKDTLAQVPPEGKAVFTLAEKEIVLVRGGVPSNKVFHIGDTLPITVAWQSHHPLDMNLTIFVHLSPMPDSPPIAQEDAQPCDNSYPTTWWAPGEIIEEYRRVVIPANAPPGQYVLTTGIYDLATGQRLPVRSPGAPPGDYFVLGTVAIVP